MWRLWRTLHGLVFSSCRTKKTLRNPDRFISHTCGVVGHRICRQEPPPSLDDLNGVPPLNRGRRLRLTWVPDPHVWHRDARAVERLAVWPRESPVPIGARGRCGSTGGSGSEETNPVLEWLVAATSAVEAVRTGVNALRAVLLASEVATEFRRSFGGETSRKGCIDLEAQVHVAETSLQTC